MLRRSTSTAGVARHIRRWLPAVVAATAAVLAVAATVPSTLAGAIPVTTRTPATGQNLAATVSPSATPAPAPAFTRVFRADFDTPDLPPDCGPYGGPRGVLASSWSDIDQIRVAGGQLRLGIARKPNGDRSLATGGIECSPLARTYGRFGIRAKIPRGEGLESFFVLWPENGGERDSSGITLRAPGAETAYVSNGYGGATDGRAVPGRYADGFHTYVMEWTPDGTRFLVDDRVIFASPHAFAGRRWLGVAASGGDTLTGLPDESATLPAQLLVDWIDIAAYAAAPAAGQPVTASPVPGPRPTPAPLSPSVVVVAGVDPPKTEPPPSLAAANAGDKGGLPVRVTVGAVTLAVLLLALAAGLVRQGLRVGGGWHRCTAVRRRRRGAAHRRVS